MDSTLEPSIYLASQSPRRRELLWQIGVPHAVVPATVTEIPQAAELPADYVQRLAREKVLAGLASVGALGLELKPVLGADTIVVKDGVILEKPRGEAHAGLMLAQLSGTTHQVMTAVAMAYGDRIALKISVTDVKFRELERAEITAYWHTGEPCDKAGGYGIQGLGAVFVEQIRGSYTGVVGLPIEQTVALLREFGVRWWQ